MINCKEIHIKGLLQRCLQGYPRYKVNCNGAVMGTKSFLADREGCYAGLLLWFEQ